MYGAKGKTDAATSFPTKGFPFDELVTLLGYCGYMQNNKGRTSGSRVVFVSEDHPPIMLHKPHPRNIIPTYQIRQLIAQLEKEGLL